MDPTVGDHLTLGDYQSIAVFSAVVLALFVCLGAFLKRCFCLHPTMDSATAPPDNAESFRKRNTQTMDDMIKTSELIAKHIEALDDKETH